MKASVVLLLSAVLGACCVLAAADEPVTWAVANCDCTKERAIVCGADGTSYLNKCWAECSHTTVEHDGPCGKLAADVSASCECTKERALVCGADGHTYLNKCWAECVDTEVAYEGACQKVADVSTSCECTKERALVCGADGHTYLNKCWAECVDTEVEYEGACKKDADVSADRCACTKERALVCGADGHTYLNECYATCSHTDVIHQGPCSRAVEHPPCACTKERDLVCGADGHTYLNACWAACSGTSVSHEGSCKKLPTEKAVSGDCEDACDKSRITFGYCGADGKSYPSQCAAYCAGTSSTREGTCEGCPVPPIFAPICDTQGYSWVNQYAMQCAKAELAHPGVCIPGIETDLAADEMLTSSECQKACPRILAPVCGMNDKSYANACRMECDGVELKHEGRCAIRGPAEKAVSGDCEDSCDKRGYARAVCGVFGDDEPEKTYPSECAAKCAGADFVHRGTCKLCPIPLIFAPACDTQGYTWSNRFELQCAGQEFAHDGPCEKAGVKTDPAADEMVNSSECQKACPRVLAPVCGMNNKSYANACRMECDGVELKHEGRCAIQVV